MDDRYSRRVAFLKRVLPAIGVTLLLLVAGWSRLAPLMESVRLGFPAIDPREARELRMVNPRYGGLDRYNRPYVVTAAIGRQVPDRDDVMSPEGPWPSTGSWPSAELSDRLACARCVTNRVPFS